MVTRNDNIFLDQIKKYSGSVLTHIMIWLYIGLIKSYLKFYEYIQFWMLNFQEFIATEECIQRRQTWKWLTWTPFPVSTRCNTCGKQKDLGNWGRLLMFYKDWNIKGIILRRKSKETNLRHSKGPVRGV